MIFPFACLVREDGSNGWNCTTTLHFLENADGVGTSYQGQPERRFSAITLIILDILKIHYKDPPFAQLVAQRPRLRILCPPADMSKILIKNKIK
jgi:hypothetical protein